MHQEGTEGTKTNKQNPPKTNQYGGGGYITTLVPHRKGQTPTPRATGHQVRLTVLGSHSKIPPTPDSDSHLCPCFVVSSPGFLPPPPPQCWSSPLSVLWGLQPWLSPGLLQRGSPHLLSWDLEHEEKSECHTAGPYTRQWNGGMAGPGFRNSATDSQ